MPPGLFNRIADKWFVLFQVAMAAAGEWPERCRKAALADLRREEAGDACGGLDIELLDALWWFFYERRVARAYTQDICDALNNMEEGPWSTANRGKKIDGHYLWNHVKGFLPNATTNVRPRRWRGGCQHKVRILRTAL
jgi:hypothetical protein